MTLFRKLFGAPRARALPWILAVAALVTAVAGARLVPRDAGAAAMHMAMSDADMARRVADYYATHPMTGTAPASAAADPAETVFVQNFQFNIDNNAATQVDTATILAGESVLFQWVNGIHTTTSGTSALDPNAGAIWDQPMTLSATQWVQAFPNEGLFPFFCRNHASMTGFVHVLSAVGVVPLPGDARGLGFLSSPSPNPSRAGVAFRFALREPGRVVAEVFDARGRRVARVLDEELGAGSFGASWDGKSESGERAPAGVYRLRLALPGAVDSRAVVLTR